MNSSEQFYFAAWHDLSTERLVEGGPIPWSKIREYAHEYEFSDFDLFFDVMSAFDLQALELIRKNKPAREKPKEEKEED